MRWRNDLLRHFQVPAGSHYSNWQGDSNNETSRVAWTGLHGEIQCQILSELTLIQVPVKWRASKCQASVQGIFQIDQWVRMNSWRSTLKFQLRQLFRSIFCIRLFFCSKDFQTDGVFEQHCQKQFQKRGWMSERSRVKAGTWIQNHWERSLFFLGWRKTFSRFCESCI